MNRIPAPDAPLMRLLRRGVFAREMCSDIACREVLTARCSYTDRYGVQCPSHWCARHAHAVQRKPYCATHIVSVSAEPVGEHRIAKALEWLGRAVDDDMTNMVRNVAAQLNENMMSEPVRFGAVGLERTRIWERTWKTYSDLGVGCRVGLGIEERHQDVIQVRVNSHVVTTVVTPWQAIEEVNPLAAADRLVPPIIVPAQIALDIWLQNAIVQLRGAAMPPPVPS